MKRCPHCGRDYNDDSLSFCLDDGSELLFGPAKSDPSILSGSLSEDEPATAIFDSKASEDGRATRVFTSGTTAENPGNTRETKPHTASRRASIIAGVIGIVVVTALGVGSYLYFGRSGSRQIESIAVMPFVNEGGDPDLEYLSDGITESLINSLSQLPNLKVIARSSSFRYKGRDTQAEQIARELNVRAIVNGRVTQRGDTLDINVELIDAQNSTQIWGRRITRKSTDILALQDEIARQVTDSLRVRLSGGQEDQLTKRHTDNEEAYKLYLQGRFYWNKRGDSLKKAVEYFKQAIDRDPNYALAYAGLAESYALFGEYRIEPPKESAPKAKAAALKALEIAPGLAEAYTALAYVKTNFEWNFEAAEKDYLKVIELNPRYTPARQWYGEYLTQMGRFDEAAFQLRQAGDFDPLSHVIKEQTTILLIMQGQYERAIENSQNTLELEPNYPPAYEYIGWAYELRKMYPEAVAMYQKADSLNGESAQTIEALEQAFKKDGWTGYSQKYLEFSLEKNKQGKIKAGLLALFYERLGQTDEAFKWLERSYENREDSMAWLNVGPDLKTLRGDPRFQDLLRRVGFK